jgi:hypothetical protein
VFARQQEKAAVSKIIFLSTLSFYWPFLITVVV